MIEVNGVATRSYEDVYGEYAQEGKYKRLHKPHEFEGKNGITSVERGVLQRKGAELPYASVKIVELPQHSPLRMLNIDKFVLTKSKEMAMNGEIKKGLDTTLEMFNKKGEQILCGHDAIRKFMLSISNIIRYTK